MLVVDSRVVRGGKRVRKLALRVERRRLLSVMIALTLCVSAMIGLLGASPSDRTDTAVRGGPTTAKTLALTVHTPILIDGNAGFSAPNASTGVTRGSGTASDPYVIEGWEISFFPANGIEIGDADVHFVIQDCYVHYAGGWGGAAIYLRSCSNGTIRNCTCSTYNSYGGFYGIYLYSSYGNIVANNTCSWNDQHGIYLYFSNGNALVDNTCSDNGDGISLYSSDSITLTNNTCSSNYYGGIGLSGCQSNTLRQNEIVGDGISIGGGSMGSQLSHFNTHTIDATNTANGKPVYYYKNQTGITVPAGAGQIILANCTGTEIENQNISDAGIGVELAYCAWTNITNSSCSNNDNGIALDESDHTTIVNVTSTGNYNGIYVGYSTNVAVRNCTLISNGYGVYFQYSRLFELSSSVFEQNSMMLYVEDCSDGCVSNNTASTTLEDYEYDFRLEYSSNVTIKGNVFGTYGLYINGYSLEHFNTHTVEPNNYLAGKPILFYANTNNVELDSVDAAQLYIVNCTQSNIRNLVFEHASVGLLAAYCDEIDVENCIVSDCKYGVGALFCSNLSFSGCEVSGTEDGFSLDHCRSVVIESSEARDNGGGIELRDSSGNILSSNNCSNNYDGIWLDSSSNNTLSYNNCRSNYNNGISLGASHNNILRGNNCSSNSYQGISLSSSSNNILSKNTCSSESTGISVSSSSNNALSNNTCNSNVLWGLLLVSSNDNTLSNNNCSSNEQLQ